MSDAVRTLHAAVEQYPEPYLRQTLLEAGALGGLKLTEREVGGSIDLGIPVLGYVDQFRSALAAHLASAGFPDVRVTADLRSTIVPHSVQRPLKPLPGVSNIVAVASGKGGVGKSTVAANLALAWAVGGARVGILDADIYGPSQPLMLGLQGQKPSTPDGKHLLPLEAYGIKVMSIGFLVDAAQAVVWRGPMVTQALTQLLSDTSWGELDYLVVDMPPGTGDIQLTLAQRVPVSGALIVTTPQDIALADARKGLAMFEKVAVPVLGIVENMSLHVCTQCGHVEHIFGEGGGARMAAETGVQLLGELPLDSHVREEADGGAPSVVSAPSTPRALAFVEMARHAAGALARRGRDRRGSFPQIVVEET
jgi:ATP-binding protein involved in chromosome partitioning